MALRTVQQAADQKGKPAFLHFTKPARENIKQDTINVDLNKVMQNMGGESFVYGTFKTAYDSDPRVKEMCKDFSEAGVTLKTKQDLDKGNATSSADGGSKISSMASRATDPGAEL
jgi:hypothetical protein